MAWFSWALGYLSVHFYACHIQELERFTKIHKNINTLVSSLQNWVLCDMDVGNTNKCVPRVFEFVVWVLKLNDSVTLFSNNGQTRFGRGDVCAFCLSKQLNMFTYDDRNVKKCTTSVPSTTLHFLETVPILAKHQRFELWLVIYNIPTTYAMGAMVFNMKLQRSNTKWKELPPISLQNL